MDHFLVASLTAKYTDFITASSVGKDNLFLVYFTQPSYFIDEYGFVKQDHYTKLGKSKYMFMYINSNY